MKTMSTITEDFKTKLKKLPKFVWIIIIIAFVAGILIPRGSATENQASVSSQAHEHENEIEFWTCSMHPQIKLPEAGQCPICFMDLIPITSSGGEEGPRELKMSKTAMALAEVTTIAVHRGIARSEVMLSGKVEYDETRVKTITTWVPGRLEHLFVDYTGISVKKGEHLVNIYSPDLYATQEELIQALKQVNNTNSGMIRESAQITLDAAREKLSLLGLTDQQVQDVEERGVPKYQLTIYSPLSGVVIHKNAVEGRYVKTGSPIYSIADLSRVWIILDAYESDLPRLRFGQEVKFTTEALPGETFNGRITFIDPTLDQKTRTVQVRINIDNADRKLKPGMFVRAMVESILDADGHAVNAQLGGKWIGSMHPEIVKDHPGKCDICGMDLVSAEELGIVNIPTKNEQPLLIPVSAVLKTGKRALVYVKVPDTSEPTFESREIILGPRAGNDYIVLSGLDVGEEVVVKGNFKIDSAMQIAAKPSMMSPEGGVAMTGHEGHGMSSEPKPTAQTKPVEKIQHDQKLPVNEHFAKALNLVYDAYLISQSALAVDNFKEAKSALFALQIVITAAIEKDFMLDDDSKKLWEDGQSRLLKQTEHAQHWTSIDEIRENFDDISISITHLMESFEMMGDDTLYAVFCPMAFNNKGATWVQKGKEVNNPYFGTKMSRCGEVKSEFSPTMDMTLMGKDHENE